MPSLNEAALIAFLATLEDGSTAAYKMGLDGALSLILKSGTPTSLGPITRVESTLTAPALNSKGQVALVVRIADGPDTVVLLTPAAS